MVDKRCSRCSNIEDLIKGVRVDDFKEPCLFFRKRGEFFSSKDLLPEGMCPELFFQVYPQYLSFLYGGERPDFLGPFIHRCGGDSVYQYRVYKKKFFLAFFVDFIWMLFSWLGNPKDLVNGKIVIECGKRMGVVGECCSAGKNFSFNQYSPFWKKRFFCPAVYYTMYPFLKNKSCQTNEIDEPVIFQCPADNTSITFRVIQG